MVAARAPSSEDGQPSAIRRSLTSALRQRRGSLDAKEAYSPVNHEGAMSTLAHPLLGDDNFDGPISRHSSIGVSNAMARQQLEIPNAVSGITAGSSATESSVRSLVQNFVSGTGPGTAASTSAYVDQDAQGSVGRSAYPQADTGQDRALLDDADEPDDDSPQEAMLSAACTE